MPMTRSEMMTGSAQVVKMRSEGRLRSILHRTSTGPGGVFSARVMARDSRELSKEISPLKAWSSPSSSMYTFEKPGNVLETDAETIFRRDSTTELKDLLGRTRRIVCHKESPVCVVC